MIKRLLFVLIAPFWAMIAVLAWIIYGESGMDDAVNALEWFFE